MSSQPYDNNPENKNVVRLCPSSRHDDETVADEAAISKIGLNGLDAFAQADLRPVEPAAPTLPYDRKAVEAMTKALGPVWLDQLRLAAAAGTTTDQFVSNAVAAFTAMLGIAIDEGSQTIDTRKHLIVGAAILFGDLITQMSPGIDSAELQGVLGAVFTAVALSMSRTPDQYAQRYTDSYQHALHELMMAQRS